MDLSAGCGEAARLAGRRERINDVIAIDERLGADVAIAESLCRWRAAVDNLNFCPRALISVPTLTSLIDSPVQGATLIGNTEITLAEVWGRGPSYMHAFSRYFPHHFPRRQASHRWSVTEEDAAATCGADARRLRRIRQIQMAVGGRRAVDRAANRVVGRLLVVLYSDLRFGCLNLRGISRLIAVADVIAGLLKTDQFGAHLRAGDGRGALSETDASLQSGR